MAISLISERLKQDNDIDESKIDNIMYCSDT